MTHTLRWLTALGVALLWASAAQAQTGLRVTHLPKPEFTFGAVMTFQLFAASEAPITAAQLFYRAPAGTRPIAEKATFTPGLNITATYTLDLAARLIPPFSTIEYWWEIRDQTGQSLTTEVQSLDYVDNRFAWQQVTRGPLNIFWYEGDSGFGQSALEVADTALRQANLDLRAALPAQLKVYIYANDGDVRQALQSVGQPWAGGHAAPELGVVMVAIPTGLDASVRMERDIPHELTHLLVYQVARDRYDRVPHWLNEGLAVMNQAQPELAFHTALSEARQTNRLLSLSQLCHPFPADAVEATLAYAQSESVTRFVRDHYGATKLRQLLEAYADGLDCSSGVERALGFPLKELEQRWVRESLNANPLVYEARTFAPWFVIISVVLLAPLLFFVVIRRA